MLLALLKKIFCCGSSESSDENFSATLKTPLIRNGSKETFSSASGTPATPGSESNKRVDTPHTAPTVLDIGLNFQNQDTLSSANGTPTTPKAESNKGIDIPHTAPTVLDIGLNFQNQDTLSSASGTPTTPKSEFNKRIDTPHVADSIFNVGVNRRLSTSSVSSSGSMSNERWDSDGSDLEQEQSQSLGH